MEFGEMARINHVEGEMRAKKEKPRSDLCQGVNGQLGRKSHV